MINYNKAYLAKTVEVTRGCDYKKCEFCAPSYYGSTGVINLDIDSIVNTIDCKEISICGVSLIDFKPSLADLLTAILASGKVTGISLQSLSPRNDEIYKVLDIVSKNKARFRTINLAIESGSNAMLAYMKVGFTAEKCIDIMTKYKDLNISASFLVGYPGETDAMFLETFNFCVEYVKNPVFFGYSRLDSIPPRPELPIKTIDNRLVQLRTRFGLSQKTTFNPSTTDRDIMEIRFMRQVYDDEQSIEVNSLTLDKKTMTIKDNNMRLTIVNEDMSLTIPKQVEDIDRYMADVLITRSIADSKDPCHQYEVIKDLVNFVSV
jgi:hypothetical protein